MAKATGISTGCWERIQRTLNESVVRPTRQDIVDENYKKFSNRVQWQYKMKEGQLIRIRAVTDVEKQEKKKQFDQIAGEERQFKEQEKHAMIERSKYKLLQQDKDVEQFNRALHAEMIKQDNKVLAEYQEKKRKTERLLVKQNGEMKPWHNNADERIKQEARQRERNTKAFTDVCIEHSREKKRLAQSKRELDREERQNCILQDAYTNQKEREERLKYKEREKQFIHQNCLKPRPPKTEQLAKSREEEEQYRHIQNDIYLAQCKFKQDLAERIKKPQRKTKIVSDQMTEIEKEKALKKKINLEIAADQLAKKEQQLKEKKKKKDEIKKLHYEVLDSQIKKKLEVEMAEKEINKEWRSKLFEADRLYEIEIQQKKQKAQENNILVSDANSVMAAERRACENELRKQEAEEKQRIIQRAVNILDPVKQYIQSELHKAEEKGLDIQLLKKQMLKNCEKVYSSPSFLEHLPRIDNDQIHLTKLEQEAKYSRVLLPGVKTHFLPPLSAPHRPKGAIHDLLRGGNNNRTPLPSILHN
ncbi:hypothetical protein XENORESO_014653 [Xenotaenia resolanae]|uniref:Trichohyalin-plectin-homology domain-containing protein n=1 Tax=Xenotaenia resolanae TaxID=208358 RepID=A0ABV0VM17_9TELE